MGISLQSRREFGISTASLLYAAAGLRAQQDVTFKTDVKVVNVLATVRTKKGEIIRNLEKDDFSLAENGHPQTIRYFARQSDLPLTIGLMVDTSMRQTRLMATERGASFRFLEQVLRDATEQVFIMQFDTAMIMRQKLTSSFKKLNDALSEVDTPDRQELSVPTSKGTVLYDAIVKVSKEVMQDQHGRKALMLLTDGVDVGSDASLTDAIEASQGVRQGGLAEPARSRWRAGSHPGAPAEERP